MTQASANRQGAGLLNLNSEFKVVNEALGSSIQIDWDGMK
jgi:hypothetical protein